MPQFKVAIYLYPQVDLLDFSGPAEIYSYRDTLDKNATFPFDVTSFAHSSPVVSASPALVYQPSKTFAEIADQITDYDILVIPGSHDKIVTDLIATEPGKQVISLIQKFAAAKPRAETGKRFLQSVCTGSLLLAASGVLTGRTATTHHLSYELLKTIADEAAGGESKVNVARQRYVDAGTTDGGVRIVTAGGVSSGIDATIHIVGELFGQERADWVAEVAEFERREKGWGV
ncbi:hypothetical protein COCMIDRAFT_88116 [Bipolaris oryzae ATCC 44560]|uniref:DJ-1/PfpI domain-containing protein n=1 Tax=Bipolaris oryzae ATCC 44560 TaxID=930090 RepID=W6ZWB8_COCMI|nr:uncharacterized protein COCMIDRAFT_88116 [Bipolaris oryzae ATCC 44560]EUC48116.1 hypothetical protein COCMIDRAFT_88116 [Bipolaris oryzae ATCC 44560]